MRHRDWSNPFPFYEELLRVFIPWMYYNYRIDNRAYEEPAAILFISATRKDCIPPPQVGLSWDSPHPPQESVRTDGRTDGRTYADVRTKIFRINGLPNLLTHGAPQAPLKTITHSSRQPRSQGPLSSSLEKVPWFRLVTWHPKSGC